MFEFSLSRAIIRSKYTVILTMGAAIGVTCLVVITSLFNNYYLTSENIFMGIHPHICIRKEGMTEKDNREIIRRLREQFPEIEAAQPALYKNVKSVISRVNKKKFFCVREKKGMMCYDPQIHSADVNLEPRYGFIIIKKKKSTTLVKGIAIDNNEAVSGIKKIINGSINLDDLALREDENKNRLPWRIYLQEDLFMGELGLKDFLVCFPETGPKQHHFLQKGTLAMGTQKGKYPLLVMSLQNAQECLGMHEIANTIEIRLNDPYEAGTTVEKIRNFLGKDFHMETWIAHSQASFAFLGVIKIMILTILFSISVVAAIGMISTLTLIVMQNKGKIAILKSMGIKHSGIYKIFLLNTGLTGIVGVAAGTALGYLFSHFFILYFSENLNKLGIKDPQILLNSQELFVIGALVIVLFLLTAIIPSRHAIATDIVDGLREQ